MKLAPVINLAQDTGNLIQNSQQAISQMHQSLDDLTNLAQNSLRVSEAALQSSFVIVDNDDEKNNENSDLDSNYNQDNAILDINQQNYLNNCNNIVVLDRVLDNNSNINQNNFGGQSYQDKDEDDKKDDDNVDNKEDDIKDSNNIPSDSFNFYPFTNFDLFKNDLNSGKSKEQKKDCPVCQCEIKNHAYDLFICGHEYCFDCIMSWMDVVKKSRRTPKCPVCNTTTKTIFFSPCRKLYELKAKSNINNLYKQYSKCPLSCMLYGANSFHLNPFYQISTKYNEYREAIELVSQTGIIDYLKYMMHYINLDDDIDTARFVEFFIEKNLESDSYKLFINSSIGKLLLHEIKSRYEFINNQNNRDNFLKLSLLFTDNIYKNWFQARVPLYDILCEVLHPDTNKKKSFSEEQLVNAQKLWNDEEINEYFSFNIKLAPVFHTIQSEPNSDFILLLSHLIYEINKEVHQTRKYNLKETLILFNQIIKSSHKISTSISDNYLKNRKKILSKNLSKINYKLIKNIISNSLTNTVCSNIKNEIPDDLSDIFSNDIDNEIIKYINTTEVENSTSINIDNSHHPYYDEDLFITDKKLIINKIINKLFEKAKNKIIKDITSPISKKIENNIEKPLINQILKTIKNEFSDPLKIPLEYEFDMYISDSIRKSIYRNIIDKITKLITEVISVNFINTIRDRIEFQDSIYQNNKNSKIDQNQILSNIKKKIPSQIINKIYDKILIEIPIFIQNGVCKSIDSYFSKNLQYAIDSIFGQMYRARKKNIDQFIERLEVGFMNKLKKLYPLQLE